MTQYCILAYSLLLYYLLQFCTLSGGLDRNKNCTVQNLPRPNFTDFIESNMASGKMELRQNRPLTEKGLETSLKHVRTNNVDETEPVVPESVMNKQSSPIVKENSSSKAHSRKSHMSAKSKHSSARSHVSSLYVKQKTKLEEARVRLKFAEREADILREQANLSAKLKILESERQLEEYAQGLSVLDAFLDVDESDSSVSDNDLQDTIKARTQNYVNGVQQDHVQDSTGTNIPQIHTCENKPMDSRAVDLGVERAMSHMSLNPEATPFTRNEGNVCLDFSKYIVKKDML